MKKSVKYLLLALCLALFVCITAMVLGKARERRHLTTCNKLEISFSDTLNFVSEEDVREYLRRSFPVFTGQRIDSLRLHEIEKSLNSRSAILSTQAWTSDSTLHISIVQREPVARMETPDHAFYIDDRGFIFPIQGNTGKRFPIIKGNLPLHEPAGYKGLPSTEEGRLWVGQIMDLLNYMGKNKWAAKIQHMEVSAGGDLILVPAEGKERIIFGKPEEFAEKFGKIGEYYRSIKPSVEENQYSSVNVKYKGQIVCRR